MYFFKQAGAYPRCYDKGLELRFCKILTVPLPVPAMQDTATQALAPVIRSLSELSALPQKKRGLLGFASGFEVAALAILGQQKMSSLPLSPENIKFASRLLRIHSGWVIQK